MPSVFSHSAIGLIAGKLAYARQLPRKFWVLAAVLPAFPDIDVIGFAFGIRYADMWGHRGLTHSLPFALLAGLLVATVFFREHKPGSTVWWGLAAFFSLVTASHGLLDGLTNGGLGVAYFAPFSAERFFLPWRPVQVSPIGISNFFSEWGVRVILSELIWIWCPVLLLLLLKTVLGGNRRHS